MLQRVYTRVSKGVARYSPRGSAAEHCSACRFFMSGGDCARVLGRVLPQGWCKYFSQETVQRWNPLWQMAGIPAPPGATLDLSFLTSGSLDPRITFTRASTATYFNYAGVMQTAATNAPRWDYNPSTLALQGLLIEEARTNLVTASIPGVGPSWFSNGVTHDLNSGTAPDASNTLTFLNNTATTSFHGSQGLANALPNVAYTCSIYVKRKDFRYLQLIFDDLGGGTPAAITTFDLQTNAVSSGFGIITNVGNGVYRCFITSSPTGAATTQVRLGINNSLIPNAGFYNESYLGVVGQGTYIWGAQVEQGAFPTSYIPTTAAAVSRAQDLCGIAPASMAPWFAPPGGSWAVEFICYAPFPNGARIIGQTGISAGISSAYLTSAFNGGQYDGVAGFNDTGVVTANAVGKICSTWAPGQAKVSTNAAVPATSAALTTGYGLLATSGVSFLQVASGGAFNTSGYLRRVTYWPRVLSNAEMQQVTT